MKPSRMWPSWYKSFLWRFKVMQQSRQQNKENLASPGENLSLCTKLISSNMYFWKISCSFFCWNVVWTTRMTKTNSRGGFLTFNNRPKKKSVFCHSSLYINNYKSSKLLLFSSFTRSNACSSLRCLSSHTKYAVYCSHIYKSPERSAIKDFF